MKIRIFYDRVSYRIKRSKEIKSLVEKVIRGENRIPGDLNFIVTGDKRIRKLNNEFLGHNYFTDVIAFNYSENEIVNGEVYMSIDTVRKNAVNYEVSLNKEVLRVMIHGTLHLCGLNDRTEKERVFMRKLEDRWIEELLGD